MKRSALMLGLVFWIVFSTQSVAFAKALIYGEVKGLDGRPIGSVEIYIQNSGYKTHAKQDGAFKLPYSPGTFTVVFEKSGYAPRAYNLSLATKDKYPLGEVVLKKFTQFYDIYGDRVQDVDITIKKLNGGQPITVDHRKTDQHGNFLLKYYSPYMVVVAQKASFRPQKIELDLSNYEKALPLKMILPPSAPGLFHDKKALATNSFSFKKKPMVGLKIPAYYDGRYSVVGTPSLLVAKNQPFEFYWMPKTPVTVGNNPFASKGGLFLFRVINGDHFVTYKDGTSVGQKIPFEIEPVFNQTEYRSGGLVQKKIQVYKAKINLPAGRYVFFEGGGNSMDREPHPEKELNSWHLLVGTQEDIEKKNQAHQRQANQKGHLLQSIVSGRTIEGGARGKSDVWPFRMRVVSYDSGSGSIIGEIEWLTLSAVHQIKGNISHERLYFQEKAYIKRGNAALGCQYTFDLVSVGSRVNGRWGGCGSPGGDAWFGIGP